jgi:hypothetical protein
MVVRRKQIQTINQTEKLLQTGATEAEGVARMIGRLGSLQGARFRSELRARSRNFVLATSPSSARYEDVGKRAGQEGGKEAEGWNKLAEREADTSLLMLADNRLLLTLCFFLRR